MEIQKVQHNISLLQMTYNTLGSLAKEKQLNQKALYYYEIFELISTQRIVQRRLEQELRLLRELGEVAQAAPPVPELPTPPPELRSNPQAHKSDFYKTIWGSTQK